jgi:hypothetical protein
MTQGSLPFKYEEEKKFFGSTSLTGLLIFLDLLHKMGFVQMVNRNLHAKADKQGWRDVQFLISLLLLNISGGDCVDDIKLMEADDGLSRIMKHLEHRHAFGRRRQKLKSQWRNGRKNAFPSPSAIFRYLLLFHNACQEIVRQEVKENQEIKAFIPAGNEHLIGLGGINKDMLEFFQLNRPCSTATIDMDATLVESQKKDALYGYKNYKCYQPLNAWWWEQDYTIYTEFRDGNVPAGFDQKRVFQETLSCLPDGVETVYLRSDSAGYQHNLLRYCELGENKRFGRIEFAIGCDVVDEFKKAVYEVEESDWHKIYKVVNGVVEETGQEWAELCYVPNEISRSKKGPDYRYIGIRELVKQRELPGMEEECQKNLPFPNMKINGNRYKLSGLVTNMNWYVGCIIDWYRERCGNSEHVHGEMKEWFGGGQLPSGKFGANAAWWWIMVLALNLTSMLKCLALTKKWKRSRMKRIRYWLINVPGRVIFESKELIVRLTRGHPVFDILVAVRQRILLLVAGKLSPG